MGVKCSDALAKLCSVCNEMSSSMHTEKKALKRASLNDLDVQTSTFKQIVIKIYIVKVNVSVHSGR